MFCFIYACGGVNFTYENNRNITNPIYNETNLVFLGKEIPSAYRYATSYIGKSNQPLYDLFVNISENTTKRSVQKNQAVSKLDYELSFKYTLKKHGGNCNLFEKIIFSRFSYAPKSSGYNFGSDESLEKKYELASKDNLQKFISNVSGIDLGVCADEN